MGLPDAYDVSTKSAEVVARIQIMPDNTNTRAGAGRPERSSRGHLPRASFKDAGTIPVCRIEPASAV